jgi:1-carboxybiuret hydrolase subunit AtzG-like
MKRKALRKKKPVRAGAAVGNAKAKPKNSSMKRRAKAAGKMPRRRSATVAAKNAAKNAAKSPAKNAAKDTDVIAALVTANAHVLGIALEPDWRPGIEFNLALILRHAALVDEFQLPDDSEPGPVFHA